VYSKTYTQVLANPTARQRVDRSSPVYSKCNTQILANPTARQRVDRSSPVYTQVLANPTARQRVDCSSPFYDVHPGTRKSHSAAACGLFKSFSTTYTQVLAKFHSAAACGSFKSRIRTSTTPSHVSGLRVSTSFCRKHLKNPHAAAMWDLCAVWCALL